MSDNLDLCSVCEGNGVLKIPGGVSTCDRCSGLGVIPKSEAGDRVVRPAPPPLDIAERIARQAHWGQLDTVTGDPYIQHIERVVALVDGDDAKTVAWLHDVVEDTPWTFEALEAGGIPARLIRPVSLLTRRPPYTYTDYIEDIATAGEPLAVTVKLADLRDHLRPNCPERLRPRYEAALARLQPTGADAVLVRPAPPPHDLSPVVEELRRRMRDCPDEDWASADAERCEGCGLPSDARQETEDGVDLCPACYAAVPMTPRLHAVSVSLVAPREPRCPRCNSDNGALGTSYAYFMCRNCADGQAVYWTETYQHPHDWKLAVAVSPWARARACLEIEQPYRPQPTIEECAAFLNRAESAALVAPREPQLEAIQRFASGEKVNVSTGVHEELTYGYGKLDANGFWEFPLPEPLMDEIFRLRHELRESAALVAPREPQWDLAKLDAYRRQVDQLQDTIASLQHENAEWRAKYQEGAALVAGLRQQWADDIVKREEQRSSDIQELGKVIAGLRQELQALIAQWRTFPYTLSPASAEQKLVNDAVKICADALEARLVPGQALESR